MTETSPGTFLSRLDDPLERRATTIGKVLPHVEAKVVDLDGKMVAAGVKGELCIRGYVVMLGYWDDEAKTRETIDSARWLHTGDLAMIDAEGYCAIVGRIKDMVIRGGENLYPREIEDFLYRHPKIRDVQVIGVPDPKYGEELCAWIIVRDGESLSEPEVREFCSGQIAKHKVPRYIKFVDGFPMTVTGKIQKYQIRELMKSELGMEDTKSA
jgi:fatty-acyl-CoA synthase